MPLKRILWNFKMAIPCYHIMGGRILLPNIFEIMRFLLGTITHRPLRPSLYNWPEGKKVNKTIWIVIGFCKSAE